MGVGSGLYMYDVVVKRSHSLSHLLMRSCQTMSFKSVTDKKEKRNNFQLFRPSMVARKVPAPPN